MGLPPITCSKCHTTFSSGNDIGCPQCALDLLRESYIHVHVNMLRGIIPKNTMRQCAHVHGAKMIEWLNHVEALVPPPSIQSDDS